MRSTRFVILSSFLLLTVSLSIAQDQPKLDSLLLQLQNTKIDTIKVKTLLQISQYYSAFNTTLAVEYARKATDLAVERKLERLSAESNKSTWAGLFLYGRL